ncbi:unnamed protein product [Mycena citricolor]|uniref:Zn(2)-C6 fungal-type domain-containing protein n=1 Tax=Mycena citricolor TaxID=2018698 RepID=A0AAD2H1Z1_9AGAR|nr:unnamed protein product [Mycena citricolor]
MITDSNLLHANSRSVVARPLKRGRACMNCRFLKIKCDGVKPICGPCRKHPKDDECEYTDGPVRSRTKALEDTVQRLEARLHELEHPDESTPSVTLFDPYACQAPPAPLQLPSRPHPASSRSLPNSPYDQVPRLLSPSGSSPESQGYTQLSAWSPPSTHGSSPLIFDGRSIATPESSTSSLDFQDQPMHDSFLHTFLKHGSQFGFFLDQTRFRQAVVRQPASPDGSVAVGPGLAPALLQTVYMWGAHLSGQRDERFRYKALQAVATDILSNPLLQVLQAEVLLGYYFFRTGHFLEARAHSATAAALAIGAGLHEIRSVQQPALPMLTINEQFVESGVLLPPPADVVEEGERINGFWAVFMLQKYLAVALDPPSRVCSVFEVAGGAIVDTPWPRGMDEYRQGLLTSDVRGDGTIRNFLGQFDAFDSPSLAALQAKACVLLHRAVHLHGQWTLASMPGHNQALSNAVQAVDSLINSLRSQLPESAMLSPTTAGTETTRTLLLTRSLLNAASIKLHSLFMNDPSSREYCLASARDMFDFGFASSEHDLRRGLGYLNPIMGSLWMTACSVFVEEIKRLRSSFDSASRAKEEEVYCSLQDGMHALKTFAAESLLMRHQLTKAQEGFESL